MGIGTAFAIYFIIWWVVLFTVLPFWARSQADEGEVILGTTHSALQRIFALRRSSGGPRRSQRSCLESMCWLRSSAASRLMI